MRTAGGSSVATNLSDPQEIARLMAVAHRVETEVCRVIVGQRDVIREVLLCLMAGGHALLEGVPGLGKTAMVRAVGQALGLQFARIQFTPDLMPSDITGTRIVVEGEGQRHFEFQPGPVFANVVLADEVNRATPKTQAALLEAMQEGQVTAAGETRLLPRPFFVLATQNPLEMEGTYPLPEAQLDRFLFKVRVVYPSAGELKEIARQTAGGMPPAASPVATAEEVLALMRLAREVPVAEPVMDFALGLVLATHPDRPEAPEAVRRFVRYGGSPRALQAILATARVRALFAGRFNVAFSDIRAVTLPAMRHRLILSFEGEAEGVTPDRIIGDLLAAAADAERRH